MALDDVDEEQDLGLVLDAGLNLHDEHLDEAVAEAEIARENVEKQAREMESRDGQSEVLEMDQNTQEAARGTKTGGVSSCGREVDNPIDQPPRKRQCFDCHRGWRRHTRGRINNN